MAKYHLYQDALRSSRQEGTVNKMRLTCKLKFDNNSAKSYVLKGANMPEAPFITIFNVLTHGGVCASHVNPPYDI